jgi:general secretion pathway protein J
MRRHAEAGFTLLEIVLAVALVALIMALVYGVVVSTVQAAEKIDELTHGSEIGPAILAQIREDLSAAFLPDANQEYFVGQDRAGRDRIDFISSVAVFASETAQTEPRLTTVNELGYQVKEAPDRSDGLILYRRVDPFIDAEPLRGGRLTMLADGVTQFRISYSNGADWQSTWSTGKNEGRLPASLRIELKIRVPDQMAEGGVAERTYSTLIPLAR